VKNRGGTAISREDFPSLTLAEWSLIFTVVSMLDEREVEPEIVKKDGV
jgi:hypothetical protein